MSSKRRTLNQPGNPRMNFRPPTADSSKWEPPRGTKPTTSPTSVVEIFTLMILHVCKKSIFFDTTLRVSIYMGSLFLISLIADYVPMPRTYMARSDNIFNYYFVKFAWGWNLMFLIPYVALTSFVYCCGERDRIAKQHLPRIAIATLAWFFWTKLFNVIEASYGMCNVKGDAYNTKQACLKGGYFWHGFDLSGHSFILIYGSLVLVEETKSILNWESIRDNIRNEEHYRLTNDKDLSSNPLRFLTADQFHTLKGSYEKFTPYIRGLFIGITLLQILWDFMLFTTMLYYHRMIEKLLGGGIAIFTWFVTYKFWFKQRNVLPSMPADGLFKYVKEKQTGQGTPTARKRTGSIVGENPMPRFMGMPLYGLRPEGGATDSQNGEAGTSR